jgi:pyruvate decarboxylase
VSFPGVKEALEESDLVINLGPLQSDSNTGGFTREIPKERSVVLAHDHCQVLGQEYPGLHFQPVLKRLVDELKKESEDLGLPRDSTFSKLEVRPILL